MVRPWYRSIFTNLRDGLLPLKRVPVQRPSEREQRIFELNDALTLPWYRSIFTNVRSALSPKKLPPLELTSKPEPANDIWGFYNYKRSGALGSSVLHMVFIGLIVTVAISERRYGSEQPKVQHQVMPVLSEPEALVFPSSSTEVVGGGGGGGDRDNLPATKGRLPKSSMQQLTPPLVVVRNSTPQLRFEPTVLVPPEIKLSHTNLPGLGDPVATIPNGPFSNGTGSGGGIGSGSGGGVGSGTGPGVGPGRGGGAGGRRAGRTSDPLAPRSGERVRERGQEGVRDGPTASSPPACGTCRS